MNQKSVYVIAGLVLGLIVVVFFSFRTSTNNLSLGSVAQSNEYQATSTLPTQTGIYVLSANPGALGSVVITLAGTGVIKLYDATTTGGYVSGASSTLATIGASIGANTYTFDALTKRGLVVEYAAFAGNSTITYR